MLIVGGFHSSVLLGALGLPVPLFDDTLALVVACT